MYRLAPPKRYRKKAKWASNILDVGPSTFVMDYTESWNATEITLITNPAQDPNTTASIKTIKNIEVTLEAEASGSWEGIESLSYYIMYKPEDITVNSQYPIKHPEYILAYKFYGSPQPEYQNTIQLKQPIKIRSRLARNLNTGDSIILLIKGANTSSSTKNVQYQGLIRWWTKSN